jgi:aryl-alcohol dehydrogenase-like predicted oxidoreductase
VYTLRGVALATRNLGSTGAEVTVLGFGAMELRGEPRGPAITDADAGRLLNLVLDEGITLIDTSIDYGRSEELIGRYLSSRRDEYFLASKCGCLPATATDATPPYPHDYTAANVRAGVEQSLSRLHTDHLDLVQVHMSPSREQLERDGTVEEMVNLRDEGKVRFLGMSGIEPHLTDHIAMGVFDVFQIPYSALQRGHEPACSSAAASRAAPRRRTRRGACGHSAAATFRPRPPGRRRGLMSCSRMA